jgi:hypothetical protein
MPQRTVTVDGSVLDTSTSGAYHFDDGDTHVWLPRSLCEWDPDQKEMTMPEWLAMDRGLV